MAANKPSIKEVKIKLEGEYGKGFKEIVASVKELNAGIANLVQNTTKQAASMDKVEKEIKDTAKATEDAAKKTKGLAVAFEGLGMRMKTFAQYRVINMMTQSIINLGKAAVDLEANFANIQAITSASDIEMGKLRDTILRVGEASKYSVEEIAKATTMLGQAGLSADEINNVLETTTQLAAGTGSELSNTVDLMTSALAVWGLNSEEASHLSDVMVTGMNRTKATLETFRMAVQYAGATMASLNVSFDEFASVAAAASNAGLRASVVGTGLRAMTSELISPTKKMVRGLAELGLSTEDVNIESQGLVNVLYKLKNAGLTAANAYDLFGKRAAQFVLAAQGQLDVVDELRVAFNESGATLKAYNTQMNTVAAQWTALGNTIKGVSHDIFDSISGLVVEALKSINWFIKSVRDSFLNLKEILLKGKIREDFTEITEQLEDEKTTARSFSDFIGQLSEKDYGNNVTQQFRDLNSVVDEFNKKFGTTIAFVDPLKDIADEIKRIKDEFNAIEDKKIDKLNEYRKYEADKLIKGDLSNDEIFRLNEISKKRKFRFSPKVTGVAGGIDFSEMTAQTLTRETYQAKVREYYEELNKRKGDVSSIKNQIQDIKSEGERELYQMALDRARDIYSVFGEISTSRKSNEFDTAISELKTEMSKTSKDISDFTTEYETHAKEIRLEEEKLHKSLNKSIQLPKEKIKELTDSVSNIVSELEEKNSIKIKDWRKQLEEKGVVDTKEQEEYMLEWKNSKQRMLDMLKAVLKTILDNAEKEGALNISSEENKQIKSMVEDALNLAKDVNSSEVDKKLNALDKSNKPKTSTYRGDAVLDRAKKFNERYSAQELALQNQKYGSDKERARRQGFLSRLSDAGLDSSLLTSEYAKLSELEDKRTAKTQLNLLESYKKDYDDLSKKVENGQISLQEADRQSASLISKMRDLEVQTSQAKARFVDLDEQTLEDIQAQIDKTTEETEKLEKEAETAWGQFKGGFKKAVKDMADSYSMNSLGKLVAEDLGNGVSDALYSIVDGTKSAKEAFSDMARSILQDISKMLIKMAVMQSMMAAFGGGTAAKGVQVYDAPIGPMMPAANGGFIPKIRAALGTTVRGGVQGKDSVPAMLMPGEYVLKKSAVDALGTNFLNDLNNNAAQTLTSTAANMMQNPYESSSESEPSVVNVWVVSKEEEAKMGPRDVIATIGKDIMTGGQTRRLIQQVVVGRK